mmetsp:Transcript_12479/g.25184  ORF Transcript_12479/g.25184 Transcript_12479/m.25184 type:complete len:207 (+) Transcript_12479:77-697(+)
MGSTTIPFAVLPPADLATPMAVRSNPSAMEHTPPRRAAPRSAEPPRRCSAGRAGSGIKSSSSGCQEQARPASSPSALSGPHGACDATSRISSAEASRGGPLTLARCFASRGATAQARCGKGHSRGKAWCSHCANRRPCNGTRPPCSAAMASNWRTITAGNLRGATTVEDDICSTSATSSDGEDSGAATWCSMWPRMGPHSLIQQTE